MRPPLRDRLMPLLVVAVLGTASWPLPGQTVPDEELRFGELVEVERVNVEVWVTDQAGRPVIGLTADDFEVFEDGQPVAITNFTEFGAAGVTASVEPPSLDQPLDKTAVLPAAEPPGHWVFYFDQFHLSAGSQKRFIKDVRGFLELSRIPPERVLILRQAENLLTEANFGSSRAELDAALAAMASKGSPEGQLMARDKRLTIDRLQQLWEVIQNQNVPGRDPCVVFPRQAIPEINRFARESSRRIDISLDHLRQVASFLAGVEGVKTLIYAGDALETHPGSDLVRFVQDVCPAESETARFDLPEGLGHAFRELTRDANANRVTVYALQTSGLRMDPMHGADQRSLGTMATARNVLGPAMRASERSGHEYLALETGGRAILNRNRFELELDKISQEMAAYYSLAYEPLHGGDGREHKIEVRVRGRALKARHRLNYRDKSSEERMADRLQSALYLGVSSNPLELRLGAGELTMLDRDRYALRLHLMLPAERVAFLAQEDLPMARLRAEVASHNLEKSKVDTAETDFQVRQPPPGADTMLDLVVTVELELGPHVLAVALRDQATNETSYVSTSVAIQPPPPGAADSDSGR